MHCSDTVCTHSIVREEDYVIRHTKGGWTKEVNAHFRERSTSKTTRQFPLIQCDNAVEGGGPCVQMVTSEDRPYIAISHVWSEGLGNPNSHTLPTSQILQLRKFASEAYDIRKGERKEKREQEDNENNKDNKDDTDSTNINKDV